LCCLLLLLSLPGLFLRHTCCIWPELCRFTC
jgi:hypothetical protein